MRHQTICSQIPWHLFPEMRQRGVRPTIKFALCDKYGNVLVSENKKGKISLPGGGIEKGERPAYALLRELNEELLGFTFSLPCIENAPCLHYGLVKTDRAHFSHKGVYLIAGFCADLKGIQSNGKDVLRKLDVLSVDRAIVWARQHVGSPADLREFTAEGLTQLQLMLAR